MGLKLRLPRLDLNMFDIHRQFYKVFEEVKECERELQRGTSYYDKHFIGEMFDATQTMLGLFEKVYSNLDDRQKKEFNEMHCLKLQQREKEGGLKIIGHFDIAEDEGNG